MPVVTVQLGQCGNQLGLSLFDVLAQEQQACGVSNSHFFKDPGAMATAKQRPRGCAARAVLIDMEPKVVGSTLAAASRSPHAWSYSGCGVLCEQSGAGNNWALGFHKYGPQIREQAVDLVRKQAEDCDHLEGFLMLQSMAGGTGAGLGAYVAQALRDEFSTAQLVNCCVWPYESGEVSVQCYNSLLTLAHLTDVTGGVLLFRNDTLHAACERQHAIPRPGFQDLNSVAARAIACALLPFHERPAASDAPDPDHHQPQQQPQPGAALRASRSAAAAPTQGSREVGGAPRGAPVHSLAHFAQHLCSHPRYRLVTARVVPQVAAGHLEYTTFTWRAILRRLKQMAITGSVLEEGMRWGASGDGAQPLAAHRCKNRAAAATLILRGHGAGEADAREFADAHAFASWAVDPLAVGASSHPFAGCQKSATLLAADQACLPPVQRALDQAYTMAVAGAFVHQYAKYGLHMADLRECFAVVEDVLSALRSL